jgi:hypothetical protein
MLNALGELLKIRWRPDLRLMCIVDDAFNINPGVAYI